MAYANVLFKNSNSDSKSDKGNCNKSVAPIDNGFFSKIFSVDKSFNLYTVFSGEELSVEESLMSDILDYLPELMLFVNSCQPTTDINNVTRRAGVIPVVE